MGFLLKIVLITALAGMGGTGLGGAAACLLRRDSSRSVSLLLSFAAGVMTSVVCFDLLTEAIAPENAVQQTSLLLVVFGVMAGYGVIDLLEGRIKRASRRSTVRSRGRRGSVLSSGHARNRMNRAPLFVAGLVMAAAIALHNVPEGMVIGASFARSAETELLSRSGLVMAAVIGLHNIPEGMAVAVPLIAGGMRRSQAVLITSMTGAPTILGALLGFCLGVIGPTALALSLSFASGAMLYMVFGELLPESNLLWQSKLPALAAIIGMMIGLLVIYA